jgi:hypothetical protein
MRLRDRLVDNAEEAWKWLSVQFAVAAAVWEALPVEVKAVVPEPYNGWMTFILLAGVIAGRVYKQGEA